ncbi:MAG: metallophosphoesterase [Alphaproteobacteria bacterium]|nr:metallophosphoesterase [Alphaproteobacteria bacterium]
MKAYEWLTEGKAGQVIKLGLFSDIHFDSPDCDRETLKAHLDACVKDGRYILFNGDFFDAIILSDRKRSAAHLIENTDQQLNIKLQNACDFLEPYQKHIIFMGRGNHEESIMKYNGIDLLQMLTTMLNKGEDHKILYGNYANFLRFTFKIKANRKEEHYDIFAHHGCGGSAPATKGMLDFGALTKGINADLLWLGHKHNALIDYSAPVMHIDKDGEVVMKNRQCIETPSYQKGRTIDYNANFAERFYNHTAFSGFGEVNLRLVAKGNGYQIIPDVKITTIPQVVIGKAQTAVLTKKMQKTK